MAQQRAHELPLELKPGTAEIWAWISNIVVGSYTRPSITDRPVNVIMVAPVRAAHGW